MGWKEDLDQESEEAKQLSSVHAVRAPMTSAYDDLLGYQATMEARIAGGDFDTVSPAVKAELLAVRSIINATVTALQEHEDILYYKYTG